MVILIFGCLVCYPLMFIPLADFSSPNDQFFLYVIFPVVMLIGCYGFFRGITEKRLIKIDTSLDRESVKRIILRFAEDKQLEIHRNSAGCIILNSPSSIYNVTDYKKSRIFLYNDGVLLFTVIKDGYKINYPVFFTHLFVKRDLEKLLGTNV